MHAYAVFGWFAQLWRDNGLLRRAGRRPGRRASPRSSIPLSLWAPAAVARREDQRRILLAVMLCYPVGYVGLMVAPHDLAILWAVLVGVGAGDLPDRADPDRPALAHARGHRRAVRVHPVDWATCSPRSARSGSARCTTLTGGWTAPLVLLTALAVPQIWLGLYVARPAYIEDQLPAPASRTISDVAGLEAAAGVERHRARCSGSSTTRAKPCSSAYAVQVASSRAPRPLLRCCGPHVAVREVAPAVGTRSRPAAASA